VSHKSFQELVELPSPGNQKIRNVMGLLDCQSFILSVETLQTRLTICLVYTHLLVAVDEVQYSTVYTGEADLSRSGNN
jgi:hypothetical protein